MATKVLSKVKIANYICIKTAKITHASSSKKHKIPHRRNISKISHCQNISKIPHCRNISKIPHCRNISKLQHCRNISKIPHCRNISKIPHSRNIFKIQYITSLKGAKNYIPITQTHDRSHIK